MAFLCVERRSMRRRYEVAPGLGRPSHDLPLLFQSIKTLGQRFTGKALVFPLFWNAIPLDVPIDRGRPASLLEV